MPFNPQRNIVWTEITKYLQRFIDEDSTLLELGAGYCHFINNIRAKKKYAVDINKEILEKYSNKEVIKISCDILEFDNQIQDKFHVVMISNLLEHLSLEKINNLLPLIIQKLHKNGILILMQPNYKYSYREYFDDYGHITVFSHISLQRLLIANNYKIIKVFKKFLPYSVNSKLPINKWLIYLYLRLPIKLFAKQMLIIAKNQ